MCVQSIVISANKIIELEFSKYFETINIGIKPFSTSHKSTSKPSFAPITL